MAKLPESARRSAAYLGGGIARGIEEKGAQVAQAGRKITQSTAKEIPMGNVMALGADPIGGRVGQFLENVGGQMQQFGSSVGTQQGMKKRDVGLIAAGLGMGTAFVGGMGANAGVNALMSYFQTDKKYQIAADQARFAGNPMPANLQTGYTQLNQYGSPLGLMNLENYSNVKQAQVNQHLLRAAMGSMNPVTEV